MTQNQKMKPPISSIYVRDDLGHAWYYDGEKIRLVLADLEAKDPKEFEENGYYCDSLEEGIYLLNEFGYITGVEYDDHHAEDYFDLKSHAEGW